MRWLVFNLSILEAEASRFLGLRAAWSPQNSVLAEHVSKSERREQREERKGKENIQNIRVSVRLICGGINHFIY